MPPVRWKHYFVTAICLANAIAQLEAQYIQNSVSMTSDGWKPIIGSGRQPTSYHEEITLYRNPSHNSEPVKVETTSSTTSAPRTTTLKYSPSMSSNINAIHIPNPHNGIKQKPMHTTNKNAQFYVLPNGVHGPHIPLSAVTHGRPGQIGQIKKHPLMGKPHGPINPKRNKPIRMQATAHSNREEIYAPLPPGTGSYSFFAAQSPNNNLKNKIPEGLGISGNKHFHHPQQHTHLDFTGGNFHQFANANENIFHSVPSYISLQIPVPQTNEPFQSQNDEYTRNLVPPPPYKTITDKAKIIHKPPVVQIEVTKPIVNQIEPQHLLVHKQEKILDQLAPPSSFGQHQHHKVEGNIGGSDVQITKEKLKVFHNQNFYDQDNIDYEFHSVKRPSEIPKLQTYEVTEGKEWQEPFVSHFSPENLRKPQPNRPQKIELNRPAFLPTPYKPEGVIPTSPTQSEVSTIFAQLSKIKSQEFQTQNPNYFDVKEVSTHYPILGNPNQFNEVPTELGLSQQEISNEITTGTHKHRKPVKIENYEITPTKASEVVEEPVRVRPSHRRRRPSNRFRTTTEEITTESNDLQKVQEESVETERPQRQKQRTRYRTSTPNYSEEVTRAKTRTRNRLEQRNNLLNRKRVVQQQQQPNRYETYSKVPPQMEEGESTEYSRFEESSSVEATTEGMKVVSEEQNEETSSRAEYELPGRHYDSTFVPSKSDVTETTPTIVALQPNEETVPIHSTVFPEELQKQEPIIKEEEDELEVEKPETTTVVTTIKPTTAVSSSSEPSRTHRIRTRPVKYDASNRPRFSVKEYKQRLKQYSSTSTTPEPYRTSSESMRIRFPNRRRPIQSTTARNVITSEDESTTESLRGRFTPKDPRFSGTTEGTNVIITEKNVKPVNTRLRPFGRYKSTTESSVATTKVSIKPNLFSKRQRPPHLSLRTRINNKNKNTTTEEAPKVVEKNNEEETEAEESSNVPQEKHIGDDLMKIKPEVTTSANDQQLVPGDILKNESFIQSQRVSDLTSSAKNEYNTPGLFKSVSPTSRRIPSYFTISTDDPILPIEAFFPNIKDKDN